MYDRHIYQMKEAFEDQMQELNKTLKKYERKAQHHNELKYNIDQVQSELEKLRSFTKSHNQDVEQKIAKLVK